MGSYLNSYLRRYFIRKSAFLGMEYWSWRAPDSVRWNPVLTKRKAEEACEKDAAKHQSLASIETTTITRIEREK